VVEVEYLDDLTVQIYHSFTSPGVKLLSTVAPAATRNEALTKSVRMERRASIQLLFVKWFTRRRRKSER
jgi:hypothetical protein